MGEQLKDQGGRSQSAHNEVRFAGSRVDFGPAYLQASLNGKEASASGTDAGAVGLRTA